MLFGRESFASDLKDGVGNGLAGGFVYERYASHAWCVLFGRKVLQPPGWSACCVEVGLVEWAETSPRDKQNELFEVVELLLRGRNWVSFLGGGPLGYWRVDAIPVALVQDKQF